MSRSFGFGRGDVFPARHAASLLNPLRQLLQSPTRTAKRMDLARTDTVIEIGCGPGYFSRAIAAAVPDGSLVLFDIQLDMIKLARQRLQGLANARYTQGDAASLPFAAAAFDAALLVLVLGEVPDQDRCLAEVARVLVRGGTLTIAESRRDSDFIPFAALKARVESHGFQLTDKHGLGWEDTARFRRIR